MNNDLKKQKEELEADKKRCKDIVLGYIDKKTIWKKGINYYTMKEGEQILLGASYVGVVDKIVSLGLVTQLEPSQNKAVTQSEPATSQPEAQTKELVTSKPQEKKRKRITEVLGDLRDLEMYSEAMDDVVFINGIDSRLKSNPIILKFLFEVRWRDKKVSSADSDYMKVKDWIAVNKDWVYETDSSGKDILFRDVIKVVRDDTTLGEYFTQGENILCILEKERFNKKQITKQTKFILNQVSTIQKRKEIIEKQGSATDYNQVFETIHHENKKDNQRQIESMVENEGKTLEEAQKEIADNMGSADALMKAQALVQDF